MVAGATGILAFVFLAVLIWPSTGGASTGLGVISSSSGNAFLSATRSERANIEQIARTSTTDAEALSRLSRVSGTYVVGNGARVKILTWTWEGAFVRVRILEDRHHAGRVGWVLAADVVESQPPR